MYIRTYFEKDNTLLKNSTVNLGSHPMAYLYYGGTYENPEYSRFIFQFSVDRLKQLYSSCQLGDLTKVKHKLVLKPTRFLGSLDKNQDSCVATSYELCLFRIRQNWESGCGNDLSCTPCDGYTNPRNLESNSASNWYYATSNELWTTEGIYDTFSGETIFSGNTQFPTENNYLICKNESCNDCTFELDMTSIVNDLISGDTPNYGFGLAFHNSYEINPEENGSSRGKRNYIGFYTNETSTFFKPYLETEYLKTIDDDRSHFYVDKANSLYLYVNIKGEPKNLDNNPIVSIYNEFDDLIMTLTCECVTKGVYEVNFMVSSTGMTQCAAWRDVWSNIRIDGISRPDVSMEFELKPSEDYYQLGYESYSPKTHGFKFRGIKRDEKIIRSDVRKLVVDVYEAFSPLKKVHPENVFYRLYVKEGEEQLDVINWTLMHVNSNCEAFMYLYTEWMLPQHYYLDFKVISNQEERTYPETVKFIVLENVKC